MVFTEKDGPVYSAGAFDIVAAVMEGDAKICIRFEPVAVRANAKHIKETGSDFGHTSTVCRSWVTPGVARAICAAS
jgi:hypothetical protein